MAENTFFFWVINDDEISSGDQVNLGASFVRTACGYAVCTGHDCGTWDDSIDYSFILSDPNHNPPNERFVMATWHGDENIEDVVDYFRWNTIFDDFVPTNFLVLFVGQSQALRERTLESLKGMFPDAVLSPKATDL